MGIDETHLVDAIRPQADADVNGKELPTLAQALRQTEEQLIRAALRETAGNRVEAARILDISRTTLYRKMAALNGQSEKLEVYQI